MKYGLSQAQLDEILAILAGYPAIEEAVLFGSRAINTFKDSSDIDIAIKGHDLPLTLAAKLKYHFEEETCLPFFVDIVDYTRIDNEDFFEHIDTKGVAIYRRGWERTNLGEIATVQTGPFGSQLHMRDYKTSGTPIIAVEHLDDNRITYQNLPLVGNADKERLSKYLIFEGDIVFSRVGSVDRRAYVSEKENGWMFSGRLLRVRANQELVNSKYLSYYFGQESFKEHIRQISVGATMPSINTSILSEVEIRYPPLPEQRAIAAILSALDDKIDLLHRQNKTLEALSQTLFRQWFVEEADEGWRKHKLEEFVEVMRGLSYKGAGLTKEGKGIPMHNLNSVYEGGDYKYEGIKYYKGEFKERHKVFPGDIIITNTEQGHDLLLIGYPAVVPRFYGTEGLFSHHIYRLKIFDTRITNQFLYYLLMAYEVRAQIAGATNGSTVNMLPKDGIEWAMFKLPPTELIEQFSRIMQQHWDKKEVNFNQIRILEKLRDTLLPKLMSGEVRVQY